MRGNTLEALLRLIANLGTQGLRIALLACPECDGHGDVHLADGSQRRCGRCAAIHDGVRNAWREFFNV